MSLEEERRAAEAWFRHRGLPLVVRSRVRGTALLWRATPALVFVLLINPLLAVLAMLLDVPDEEFEQRVDNSAFVIVLLAISVAAVVIPVLAGWLVSRWQRALGERGKLVLALVVLALVLVVVPVAEQVTDLGALWLNMAINLGALLLLLAAVRIGAGAILAWALRSAVRQLGAIGSLASRALPLLMLVVLFAFFSTEMWQIADALPRWQLWCVVALFAGLATLFLGAMLSDELREMVAAVSNGRMVDLVDDLTPTPLRGLAEEDAETGRHPLTHAERLNVTLVLFLAQALQIVVFSVLTFCLFLVLGTLAVRQSVVQSWLGKRPGHGELFGIELPVSHPLVQLSLFLAVFSGLYFAASAATDPHYRKSFFEPLLADVRVSLSAREVYLARWANRPAVKEVSVGPAH